jgi:SiaC family regulatory phosphoprotein
MEKFHLDGSPKTPTIDFDGDTGVLELRGRSIPENSVEFYGPLNDWLEKYEPSAKDNTTVDMKLEYFNTSSSKCILDFFKRLEKMNGNATKVHVNWYFETEDEDMAEAGEDYQAIVELPFSIIEVEEI